MTDTTLPMTRARWTILAVGMPVVLGLVALCTRAWVYGAINSLANLSPYGYTVAFSVPAGRDGSNLTLTNGDITFHSGHRHDIHVRGNLTGSLAAPEFTRSATRTGLTLNPSCRAPIGICNISFNVTGPDGLPTSINDTFGNIDASRLHGDVTLTSNSGNIAATGLTGTVRLNDSFGSVNVTGVSGNVKMISNSADITAARVSGDDMQIFNSYGSVNVTGMAAADVGCTSNSADITIVFSKVPKRVQINDSYGSVNLELPDTSTAYLVDTRNSYGSTFVSVPRSQHAQNTITVDGQSADISITRQGQNSSSTPGSAP
jgi:hypothetical protein